MENERRQYPRIKMSVPVELWVEGSDTPIRTATSDLSFGGCYIENLFPLSKGTAVELRLQLTDTVLILGIVVTSDPQVGNGIMFSRMLPEDIEQLREFVEAARMDR
jgi:c-di-GMP-binding flagellar brake protein YcgR